jgi:osmotically-inducible protein OsmY
MARSRSPLALAATLVAATALSTALGGCVGAVVVGGLAAAGGAGYAAGQERGVNGVANDLTVKTDIEAAFLRADPRFQYGITTTVYEGRVLLTGRVPTQQMKLVADQIAGQTKGVRALYDDVVVAPSEQAWNDAQDAWTSAGIRSKMIVDPAIRSVNYLVETANGSVFLIGSARDQGELDRVTQIASYQPGVRRVVSYISLRPGVAAAVAAMPAAPPGAIAAPPAGAGYPGAATPAPIEVQKL